MSKVHCISFQHCHPDTQGTSISSIGFTLTSETQGPKPSAGHTNTTSTLSTSTASVNEIAVTTSLTHDSAQLTQNSGITPELSKSQVLCTHQFSDFKSVPLTTQEDPTVVETEGNTCENNVQEENAMLRSTSLVRSVMSTSTTVTNTTTEIMSSDKSNLCTENTQPQVLATKEEVKNVSETAEAVKSCEMFSSVDSNTWGDSTLIDSVVKIELKEPIFTKDDHPVTQVTSSVIAQTDHPSIEMGQDICNEKTDQSSSVQETAEGSRTAAALAEQPKQISLVEVEEVKMTISHLSFNIAGTAADQKVLGTVEANMVSCGDVDESSIELSSVDVSPAADFQPDNLSSCDLALCDSTIKDRKRKITETETDLDNFDELIAGLKEVAEKDIDLTTIEGNRRRGSMKDLELEQDGDEKFSLLKIRRCDDDDLESLASIDTDMAPASEASRDLEGTFSDLESVSESVSSKGDSLFSPATQGQGSIDSSRTEEFHTIELVSQQSQIVSSEAITHMYIKSSHELVSPVKKEMDLDVAGVSSREVSSSNIQTSEGENGVMLSNQKETSKSEQSGGEVTNHTMDYEQLPVEKLQAMIAELEEVMSDTELSDTDDETGEGGKEGEDSSPSVKETNESKTGQSNEVADSENQSIIMTSVEMTPEKEHLASTVQSKMSSEESKDELFPIEFSVQEVHVAGDIEFAKARSSVQPSNPTSIGTPMIVVTATSVHEEGVQKVPNTLPEVTAELSQKGSQEITHTSTSTVQKVSVHSSQVVHGMTLVTSTEDRLPEPEEAVLVTLISRPSSVEALATDSESTGNKTVMEQVEEENSDPDIEFSDREKQEDEKEEKEAREPSSSSSSSGDSSEDEESVKERSPTIIECSSISVALEEGNAEETEEVSGMYGA